MSTAATCAHWARVLVTCYHGPGHGATETCAELGAAVAGPARWTGTGAQHGAAATLLLWDRTQHGTVATLLLPYPAWYSLHGDINYINLLDMECSIGILCSN